LANILPALMPAIVAGIHVVTHHRGKKTRTTEAQPSVGPGSGAENIIFTE
jgi:hypothetical protein